MSFGRSNVAVQKKVCTRICNNFLRQFNYPIIENDDGLFEGALDDGKVLRLFLMGFSHKVLPECEEPKLRIHKVNNLNISFKFMREENIKLVGIGSEDIIDRTEKLIFGMIWTVVWFYNTHGGGFRDLKQKVLDWLRDLGIDANLRDFNWESLRDLLNVMVPGSLSKCDLGSSDLDNTRALMRLATDVLDVPSIFDPEDLLDSKRDDLAILTYLSYFLNQSKGGYPYPSADSIKHLRFVEKRPTTFQIKTVSASTKPEIRSCFEDAGFECDIDVVPFSDDGVWTVTVTPHQAGSMKLTSAPTDGAPEFLFGFPLDASVASQPKIFVNVPSEAYISSKFDIKLEVEGDEALSGISVIAKSRDGKEFPVVAIAGNRYEIDCSDLDVAGDIEVSVKHNGEEVSSSTVVFVPKPTFKWLPLKRRLLVNQPISAVLECQNMTSPANIAFEATRGGEELPVKVDWTSELDKTGKTTFFATARFVSYEAGSVALSAVFDDKKALDVKVLSIDEVSLVKLDGFDDIQATVDELFSFPLTLKRLNVSDIRVNVTCGDHFTRDVLFTITDDPNSSDPNTKRVSINLRPVSTEDLTFTFSFKDEDGKQVVSHPISVKVAPPKFEKFAPPVLEKKEVVAPTPASIPTPIPTAAPTPTPTPAATATATVTTTATATPTPTPTSASTKVFIPPITQLMSHVRPGREDKEYSFVVEGVSHDELQVKAVELDTKKNVAVKVGPVKQRAGKNGKSSEDEEKGEDGTIKPKGKRCKVSLKPTHAGIVSLSGYVENTLIGDAQLVVIKPKPKATIESALPGEAFVGHPASFKLNTNTVESDQLDAIEIKNEESQEVLPYTIDKDGTVTFTPSTYGIMTVQVFVEGVAISEWPMILSAVFKPTVTYSGPPERSGIPGTRFTLVAETLGMNPKDLVVDVHYGSKKIAANILTIAENDRILEEERRETVAKSQITPRRKRLMELTSSAGEQPQQIKQHKEQQSTQPAEADITTHKKSFSKTLKLLVSPKGERDSAAKGTGSSRSVSSRAGTSSTQSRSTTTPQATTSSTTSTTLMTASTTSTASTASTASTVSATPTSSAALSLNMGIVQKKKEEDKRVEMKQRKEDKRKEKKEEELDLSGKSWTLPDTIVISVMLPECLDEKDKKPEDREKVKISLYPKGDSNKVKINVGLVEKAVARIVSVDGPQLVEVPMTVMLELVNLKPEQLDAFIETSNNQSRKRVTAMKGLHGFTFTPLEENEILYKDTEEHIVGSPYTFTARGPKPWARITNVDVNECTTEINQQFYFKIETSANVEFQHLKLTVIDTKLKIPLPCLVEESFPHSPQENDSDEDVAFKYFDCHFFSPAVTQANVRVLLFGQPIQGAPFTVNIVDESEVFTKVRQFDTVVGQRISIDDKQGIQIQCNWQNKNNTAFLLGFNSTFMNDLGEVQEIMCEGSRISSTGALEISKPKKHSNQLSISLRPTTLREDMSCIPIIITCLKGNFSSVKKMVITLYQSNTKLSPHYYCELPTGRETSFLIGCVACENGVWYIDMVSKYATGRFALDLLTHIQPQISKYTPFKPLSLPSILKRGHAITINPNITHLLFNTGAKSDLRIVALFYSWKNHFKYAVEPGQKQKGIANLDGSISIMPHELPWMCKNIFFIILPSKVLEDQDQAASTIQQLTRDFEVFEDLDSVNATWTVCSEKLTKTLVAKQTLRKAEASNYAKAGPVAPSPRGGRPALSLSSSAGKQASSHVQAPVSPRNRGQAPASSSGATSTTAEDDGMSRKRAGSRLKSNIISPRGGKDKEKEAVIKRMEEKRKGREDQGTVFQKIFILTFFVTMVRKKEAKIFHYSADEAYDLAKFEGHREEIGVASAIIQGRFYRRAINAPWEYIPISVGVSENDIETIATPEVLSPYLPLYFRMKPRNLRVGESTGVPKKAVFVEITPPLNTAFSAFSTKIANTNSQKVATWGESFVYLNMEKQKRNLFMQVTLYHSLGVGANECIGEVQVNMRKFYQESIDNGGRVVHKTFKVVLPKKDKTIKPTLKLRFVAQ